LTAGDPAGIGPEILLKALESVTKEFTPVVYGHWPSLERTHRDLGIDVPIFKGEFAGEARRGAALVLSSFVADGPLGTPCRAAGQAQFAALERAVSDVLAGHCTALVTGPVSKLWVSRIKSGFAGHTEYLAGRCGVAPDDVTMLFVGETSAVGLVSTHLPLARVADAVTISRLERTFCHVIELLRARGAKGEIRVGVAGLNPHAGEGGLLGSEESEVIGPFCLRADRETDGVTVQGPFPADVLFRRAQSGDFDGIVALYHDQAMIPIKLAGVGRTVNVTMGLPFVRTSPDHGVAYDIAGTGRADQAGMIRAIELAVDLAVAD